MNTQNQSQRLIFILICLLVGFAAQLRAETEPNQLACSQSAPLLPKGQWEIGIFQPLRFGWSESLELSTHPLLFFLLPNLAVKWAHGHSGDFTFTSRHAIYYPTILLRALSREGTGGIISPEFEIPHLLALGNELLVSRAVSSRLMANAKLGFKLGLKSGAFDKRTTIDLPLVYPRLLVFYHDYQFISGVDFSGWIWGRWYYLADVDWFYTPTADFKSGVEHKLMLRWKRNSRFQINFGYKLVYGEYPFGTQWHFLGPLFDGQWTWGK
jgi:hypothetical protein